MLDWLNMANPFQDPNAVNPLAPGGPTGESITGAPLAILSFTAPEELAKMVAQGGVRVNPNAFRPPPSGVIPGMPLPPAPPGATTSAPPAAGLPPPGPAFGDPSITNPQSGVRPTQGPAGLAGVGAQNKLAQALGAVRAVQPTAAPMVPAPGTPRIDSPPVYKPDASMLMQLMAGGGGAAIPTLAQLLMGGGLR